MTEFYRRVTGWITREQSEKIKNSGMSDSEFLREAIDEKDYQFGELKRRIENHVIDDLIQYLSDKKGMNCQTTCQTNRAKNDEFVRQIYSEMGTCQTNLSDKQGENVRQTPEEVFGDKLQTIVNILHTESSVSNTHKNKISNQMGISTKELQKHIDEYKEDLLKMPMKRTS